LGVDLDGTWPLVRVEDVVKGSCYHPNRRSALFSHLARAVLKPEAVIPDVGRRDLEGQRGVPAEGSNLAEFDVSMRTMRCYIRCKVGEVGRLGLDSKTPHPRVLCDRDRGEPDVSADIDVVS
jgi:hypothetical protein